MSELFTNKVAESGIITIDLSLFFPKEDVVVFDLKDFLFMGLILKEKDFRQALKDLNKDDYKDKNVAVTCSADAIVPMWAYMLVSATIRPIAKSVNIGSAEEIKQKQLLKNIDSINAEEYAEKRVVIKGCGETPIPEEAYFEITKKLQPVVISIMYGEPCSTVPVYKRPKL